jgi:hypothetical protein
LISDNVFKKVKITHNIHLYRKKSHFNNISNVIDLLDKNPSGDLSRSFGEVNVNQYLYYNYYRDPGSD